MSEPLGAAPDTEAIRDGKGIIGFQIPDDTIAYHWSPTSRRGSITIHGLRTRQASAHAPIRYPMICFCLDPLDAWEMSGGTFITNEPDWDLWAVRVKNLRPGVEVIPYDDRTIRELRCYRTVPARYVRYLATRGAGEAGRD
jgi:hypothetical protein